MGFWTRAARAYGIEEARAYGRQVWIVTWGQLVAATGRGIAIPFVVLYLVAEVGISLAIVGIAVLVEQIARSLASPAAGWASDRWGRKKVMIAGLLGMATAIPSYVLVDSASGLVLLSIYLGLAQAIYPPASQALVADVTPANRRSGAFGLIHMSRNLGWSVGIAIGGIAAATSPGAYGVLFLAAGLAPLAYMALVAIFIEEPIRVQAERMRSPFSGWGRVVTAPRLALYLALSSAFFLAFGQFNNVMPLFIQTGAGLPAVAVSVLFGINPVLVTLLQLPLGTLGDRFSRTRIIATSGVILAAGYAAFACTLLFDARFWPMVAAVVLLSVGEVLFAPVLGALASDLAPPGLTGTAMGVLNLAAGVGQAAAPLLAGAIVAPWGWPWVWTVFAAYTVLSAIGMLFLRSRLSSTEDRPRLVAVSH